MTKATPTSQKKRPSPGARSRHLNMRLTEEEHAAFTAMADQSGTPVTVWARMLLRRAAGLKTPLSSQQ